MDKLINVYKNDGQLVPYDESKIRIPLRWAIVQTTPTLQDNTVDTICNRYLEELKLQISDAMPTKIIFSTLIKIVAADISRLHTDATYIASKLYLLQMYRQSVHNIKPFVSKQYPTLKEVLELGTRHGLYDNDKVNTFSEEDIVELNEYIRYEEDFTFNFNAILTFSKKYCKVLGGKYIELPQITYMRVAMGLVYDFINEKEDKLITGLGYDRIELIKALYDIITKGQATFGSTIMNNSLVEKASMSNCVLNTIGNSTYDIHNKYMTAGKYTKAQGGLAFDVSLIQSIGSLTSNGIAASGIVKYIIVIEKIINSMAQGENRRGAAVITCSWWHSEIMTFLELKDNTSGTENNRALQLVYSLATNDFLYNAVANDEEVNLFNPIDAPKLNEVHGEEWVKTYHEYSASLVPRTTIRAKELFDKHLKFDYQTGHQYEIRLDVVNSQGMLNKHVTTSNLCVVGTTYLLTDKGNVRIESVAGTVQQCWNGKEFAATPIYKVSENDMIYKVITSDGGSLRVTAGHMWTANNKVVNTLELHKGDVLPSFKFIGMREGTNPHIDFPTEYKLDATSTKGRDFIPSFDITHKSFMFWFKKVNLVKVLGGAVITVCKSPMYARRLRLALQERGYPSEVLDSTIYYGVDFSKELGFDINKTVLPKLTVRSVKKLDREEAVYCGTESLTGKLHFNGVTTLNCGEITLPSRPAKFISEELDENNNVVTVSAEEEIALCNLASFNMLIHELPDAEYRKIILIISIALDNTIDITHYIRASAKLSNLRNRYIGLGQSNLAYLFARKKLKLDSKEGLIEQARVFDRLSATIWDINADLGQIFGVPEAFHETKWAEGKLPYDEANSKIKEMYGQYFDHERHDRIRVKTIKGVRNLTMMATAPTASSANAKGLLDACEPIHALEYRLEGSIVCRVMVPEVNRLHAYYTLAYEADQHMLTIGNAIRQMVIDQSQSTNRYVTLENANYDYLYSLKILSQLLGIKTHYYLNSEKEDTTKLGDDVEDNIPTAKEEECLSCGS